MNCRAVSFRARPSRSADESKGLRLAGPYRRSWRQISIVAGSRGRTQHERTAKVEANLWLLCGRKRMYVS
eukprot:3712542-Prymnesium_polylepis.1